MHPHRNAQIAPMVSTMYLSLLAALGFADAFVRTPFLAEQVRHHPVSASRTTTGARTATRMVAADKATTTRVKRNEHFEKLKVIPGMLLLPWRCTGLCVKLCGLVVGSA